MSADELASLESASGRGLFHLELPRQVLMTPPPPAASRIDELPIWRVPLSMQTNVHPPLYFLALRLWIDYFGSSDAACRGLSAVFNVLGVLVIFDVGRFLGGAKIGLWAALLMALAQPEINHAQDARPYTMVSLFALTAAAAMLRIAQRGSRPLRLLALGASVTAACLTHYFVFSFIVALALYGVTCLRGAARRNVTWTFLIAGAVVALLWGRHLWEQRQALVDPNNYWHLDDQRNHVAATFYRLAVLPGRYLVEPPGTAGASAAMAGILYFLPWPLSLRRPQLLLPALWLVGSVAMVAGADTFRGTKQLEEIKYTLVAAPGVYLLLPMLIARGRLSNLLPAAAAIACLVGLPQTYQPANNDFRDVALAWDKAASPNEPLLIATGGWDPWYGGLIYLSVDHYAVHRPQRVILLDHPPSPQIDADLRKDFRRCWFMSVWGLTPAGLMPGWQYKKIHDEPGTAALFELTPIP